MKKLLCGLIFYSEGKIGLIVLPEMHSRALLKILYTCSVLQWCTVIKKSTGTGTLFLGGNILTEKRGLHLFTNTVQIFFKCKSLFFVGYGTA